MDKKAEILKKIDKRAYYTSELGGLGKAKGDGWVENTICPFHIENTASFGYSAEIN